MGIRRNMKYKKTRKVDARALRLSLDFERPKASKLCIV